MMKKILTILGVALVMELVLIAEYNLAGLFAMNVIPSAKHSIPMAVPFCSYF